MLQLRKQNNRDNHARETAVERHAAIPRLNDLDGMGSKMRGIVEQHIADAAAADNAESRPRHEIVDIEGRHRRLAIP